MPSKDPALPSTLPDFLALVRAKEETPGAAYAILSETQRTTLDTLLEHYAENDVGKGFRTQVYLFLVEYRQMALDRAVLDRNELIQLDRLLGEASKANAAPSVKPRTQSVAWPSRNRIALVVAGLAIVVAAIGGVINYVSTHQSGPPAGTAQQHPPAQQVPPGNTNLQNFKQEWGPWAQLTPSDQRPQTETPALLLFEQGGTFASKWTIPSTASEWQVDITGDITNVNVKGTFADISDVDGNPYVVSLGQPFVFSSNPDRVFVLDSTGNVDSMTLAQATAVRQPFNK